MKKGPPPKLQRGLSIAQFVSGVDASQLEKVRELWDQLDTKKKGAITKEDLAEVLYGSNVDASEEEVEGLMRELDRDGDGLLSFKEFAHSVIKKQGAGQPQSPKVVSKQVGFSSPKFSTSAEKITPKTTAGSPKLSASNEKVAPVSPKTNTGTKQPLSPEAPARRKFVRTQSVVDFVQHLTPSQLAEMQKLFNHYDNDKDGKIDHVSVRTIIRDINPNLANEDISSLLQTIDGDHDGLVTFREFIDGTVIVYRSQQQQQQQNSKKQVKTAVEGSDDDDYFTDDEEDDDGNGAGSDQSNDVTTLKRDLALREQVIHTQQKEIEELNRKLSELQTDNTKLKTSLKAFLT